MADQGITAFITCSKEEWRKGGGYLLPGSAAAKRGGEREVAIFYLDQLQQRGVEKGRWLSSTWISCSKEGWRKGGGYLLPGSAAAKRSGEREVAIFYLDQLQQRGVEKGRWLSSTWISCSKEEWRKGGGYLLPGSAAAKRGGEREVAIFYLDQLQERGVEKGRWLSSTWISCSKEEWRKGGGYLLPGSAAGKRSGEREVGIFYLDQLQQRGMEKGRWLSSTWISCSKEEWRKGGGYLLPGSAAAKRSGEREVAIFYLDHLQQRGMEKGRWLSSTWISCRKEEWRKGGGYLLPGSAAAKRNGEREVAIFYLDHLQQRGMEKGRWVSSTWISCRKEEWRKGGGYLLPGSAAAKRNGEREVAIFYLDQLQQRGVEKGRWLSSTWISCSKEKWRKGGGYLLPGSAAAKRGQEREVAIFYLDQLQQKGVEKGRWLSSTWISCSKEEWRKGGGYLLPGSAAAKRGGEREVAIFYLNQLQQREMEKGRWLSSTWISCSKEGSRKGGGYLLPGSAAAKRGGEREVAIFYLDQLQQRGMEKGRWLSSTWISCRKEEWRKGGGYLLPGSPAGRRSRKREMAIFYLDHLQDGGVEKGRWLSSTWITCRTEE